MLLLDMDMPNCCQDCPIYDHEFGCCELIPNSRYYDNDGIEHYDPFEERNKDCPLREDNK